MSHDVRILMSTDGESVMAYAKARLAARIAEPMEREMQSWNARWRAESLMHYLPQGWSFGAFDSTVQMRGYILAQPVLFFRGLTQTLWVEHMEFDSPTDGHLLLDTALRWARDKHLQCVLVESSVEIAAIVSEWPRTRLVDDRWIEMRSAKF